MTDANPVLIDPPGRPRITLASKYLLRISYKKTSGRSLVKFGKCPLVYGAADQLTGYHIVSRLLFRRLIIPYCICVLT